MDLSTPPDPPPWRRERPVQFAGLPAWSMPAAASRDEEFRADLFRHVDARWAWEGADGAGVRVCVMDSGVSGDHPLAGPVDGSWQVTSGPDGEPRIEECDPADGNGHGTACAGIIRGIAPKVSLSSMRVLHDGRYGSGTALLAGLEHAIDLGFDLINMSLSTAKPEFQLPLARLADQAYFRRCVLVVSAHNLPVVSFPWSFASVISVASHDGSDPMCYYYNTTPPVDFHARGVRVPVARPGGGQMRSTGNSFAAPHIIGIAALILSKRPWLTPFQLKSVLYQCAANVAPLREGEEGYDD